MNSLLVEALDDIQDEKDVENFKIGPFGQDDVSLLQEQADRAMYVDDQSPVGNVE